MMLISSTFIIANSKVFANSGSIVIQAGGISESQPIPEVKEEYFYGFPSKIYVGNDLNTIAAKKVVLDIYAHEDLWIDGNKAMRNESDDDQHAFGIYHGFNSIPGFFGYIDANGKVLRTLSQGCKKYIKRGEVLFSIILDSSSPILERSNYIKNRGYWKKIADDLVTPFSSSKIEKSTSYGVTNTESLSLAKTTGSTLSYGMNFGIEGKGTNGGGSFGGSVNYQISNSLTQTFSRTISIEESTTTKITHNFDSSSLLRRVSLYQYCEEFYSNPILNLNYKSFSNRNLVEVFQDQYNLFIKTGERYVEVKTSSFLPLEIERAHQTSEIPNLKELVVINQRPDGIITPSNIEIRNLTQVKGNAIRYNFTKDAFSIDGRITLNLAVNVRNSGIYKIKVLSRKGTEANVYVRSSNAYQYSNANLNSGLNNITFEFLSYPNYFDDIKEIYIYKI